MILIDDDYDYDDCDDDYCYLYDEQCDYSMIDDVVNHVDSC